MLNGLPKSDIKINLQRDIKKKIKSCITSALQFERWTMAKVQLAKEQTLLLHTRGQEWPLGYPKILRWKSIIEIKGEYWRREL